MTRYLLNIARLAFLGAVGLIALMVTNIITVANCNYPALGLQPSARRAGTTAGE